MTDRTRTRVWVAYPPSARFDAIAQHARGLTDTLNARGIRARYDPAGARAVARRAWRRDGDWLFVEYMPYSYGRWGVAPALVLALALTRARRGAPRIALMVHEEPIAATHARAWLMGTWQRWQLRAAARLAHAGFGSTEANCTLLARLAPGLPVSHLPIPSNVPPVARDRAAARARLGIDPGELVIAAFGGRHPSRALEQVDAALAATLQVRGACTFLNLGAEAPAPRAPAGVRVIAPGPAKEELLSAHLAASDIYLAPFRDGASTRRTTLAAAFAHGLAVVGTDGAQTDALLRGQPPPCVLTPVDRPDLFAAACARLAGDADERAALGAAALALYDARLGWEACGERLADALGAAATGGAAR
jgi:hypothetical protein